MTSQTAVCADSFGIPQGFTRGIHFWHSWGVVPTKELRTNTKPVFLENRPPKQKNAKTPKSTATTQLTPQLDFNLAKMPKIPPYSNDMRYKI